MSFYTWNDFGKNGKPLGSLHWHNEIIKPGDVFEADPAEIKKMGPEIAKKCVPAKQPAHDPKSK